MSDSASSSLDSFVEDIDGDNVDGNLIDDDNVSDIKSINSRQKLEQRLDDWDLEKDLREFDFDI